MRISCPSCGKVFLAVETRTRLECACGCEMSFDFRRVYISRLQQAVAEGKILTATKAIRALTGCELRDAWVVARLVVPAESKEHDPEREAEKCFRLYERDSDWKASALSTPVPAGLLF